MKISQIIKGEKPSFSLEVFPPKTSEKFESIKASVNTIADLKPSFMSVTYGAGGSTAGYTKEFAEIIKNKGITPLAHLTCIGATKESIRNHLESLKSKGIENILALRGDIPEGYDMENSEFHHASELAEEIKKFGGFCVGGACYPEVHPESLNSTEDIISLKKKVDAGCEFLTTQMFFDNDILYNFMYRMYRAGVDVPVVAGIMPVTNAAQIKRITDISKNTLPQRFLRIVDRYGDNPDVMKQAGIAFATEQIIDLYANGIHAVHVYTMNKPDVAAQIMRNISEIIK